MEPVALLEIAPGPGPEPASEPSARVQPHYRDGGPTAEKELVPDDGARVSLLSRPTSTAP